MGRSTIDFHNKVYAGKNPEVYFTVTTHMGQRLYAGETLSDNFESVGALYDGFYTYDGSITYGQGDTALSKEPRVLSWGTLRRTLSPKHKELMIGFTLKRQASFSVKLNNTDRGITKLMGKEPFINRPLSVFLGFEDVDRAKHMQLYSGVIDKITVTNESITLQAVEV